VNPSTHRDEFNDHRKATRIKELVDGGSLIQLIEKRFKVVDLLNQFNISHTKNDGSTVDYNVELRRYYENKDFNAAFWRFLDCLYKIRYNLLHGVKERENYQQRKLLKTCHSSLLIVEKGAFNKYVDLTFPIE